MHYTGKSSFSLPAQMGHTEPVTLHAILLLSEKLKKSIVSVFFYQLVIFHSAASGLGSSWCGADHAVRKAKGGV